MKTPELVNSAKPTVDIIVVTFNNGEIFHRCIKSLTRFTSEPFRLIIVNNGDDFRIEGYSNVVVIKNSKNLGWIGGINAGIKWCLENSASPFICFLNDDVQILEHDYGWLSKMLYAFQLDPKVGAVGPSSNAIMGYQSLSHVGLPPAIESTRLSGMCMLLRREVVNEIGLLDESLPGGDDLDYSMRLREAGYKLCICRRAFLLHHYATTGRRVHGEYWDSRDHTEAINTALIRKHGFKNWYCCVTDHLEGADGYDFQSPESKFALSEIAPFIGDGLVLDLGCGGAKIHPKTIGVDIRPSGNVGVGVNLDHPSVSDITAEVSDLAMLKDRSVDAICARHIVEHLIDIPKALKEWKRVLKPGGKLVIISPDYRHCEAISVDPSHVHALTAESLVSIINLVGGLNRSKYQRHLAAEVWGPYPTAAADQRWGRSPAS